MFVYLQKYMQCVQNLQFDEKPDYDHLRGLLKDLYKGVDEYIQTVIINKYTEHSIDKIVTKLSDIVAIKQREKQLEELSAKAVTLIRGNFVKAMIAKSIVRAAVNASKT